MKKYLADLRQELSKTKLTKIEIEDIITDHQDMIESALSEGLTEDEIEKKFGKPSQIAQDLAMDSTSNESSDGEESTRKLWKSFDVAGNTIKTHISVVSEQVIYASSPDNQIHVYQENIDSLDEYKLSFTDETLSLTAPKRFGAQLGISFLSRSYNCNVIIRVEIPKEIVCEDMYHKSVSSEIKLEDIKALKSKFSTVSGDINIHQIDFIESSWHTVSGDINMKQSTFESVSFSCVSGELNMKTSKVSKRLDLSTVSGGASVEELTLEEMTLSTVSGNITGKNIYPKKISLRSISGSVVLNNDQESDMEIIRQSTLSGTIKIHH